ncbi:hypothetical protein C4K37_3118 [Pseudomonas chlororaphis subsp. piscium]|nr:hypothetical protein C4K37_3118 [Pseudomonas chlororaphis subsp. piscium]AZC50709.1 hypothetical protein C4K35_3126 [Pseudomonas chlororaphis subsp. piscium]AZC75918.1 hypothetical protein C4K31_3015 [Pseudomonas chlororaphis subsp. piscium]
MIFEKKNRKMDGMSAISEFIAGFWRFFRFIGIRQFLKKNSKNLKSNIADIQNVSATWLSRDQRLPY